MSITTTAPPPSTTHGGTAHMLPAERARASFDVQELIGICQKGKPAMIEKFSHLFDSNPVFDNEEDNTLSYEELFKLKQRRVTAAFGIVRNNDDFLMAHMRQKVRRWIYIYI
jgi:hypothetical protein